MKSTCSLHLVLIALATSSFSAPIPLPRDECSSYSSCSPSFRSSMEQWQRPRHSQSTDPLQEPHFPAHQILPEQQEDNTDERIIEHLTTPPKVVIQPELPPRIHRANAALEATIDAPSADKKLRTSRPKTISITTTHSSTSLAAADLEDLRDVDIHTDHSNLEASILERMRLAASHPRHKCHDMSPMALDSDSGMTITYTYSYGYIRRDYTDVVVVGIVLLFLLVVIAVELVEKMGEMTRIIFGPDQGRIRLEDSESGRYVHVVRVDVEGNREHESPTDEKQLSC